MILARIARALKDQNWLAVGIEFVIVVLGIVIGFQVNSWSEHRVAEARALSLTENLVADLHDEQWRIVATQNYLNDVITVGNQTLAVLEGHAELDDEQLVIGAFRSSQYYWSGIIRVTYDEIVATGAINLISDDALREAAVEYFNSSSSSLLAEIESGPYRETFRTLVDPALHEALVRSCGEDISIAVGDFGSLESMLDFPCEIDGHDAAITRAAALIRNSDVLIPYLRRRIIEAGQNASSIVYYKDLLEEGLINQP